MKEKEDYPIILKVKEIAEILSVSERSAYDLMERPDFPLIRIGRQKRVQREAFFDWLDQQPGK